jgi:phage shock protein A
MRIEQQGDGTYVKKLNQVEQAVIERLYKEIEDRLSRDKGFEDLIGQLQLTLLSTNNVLEETQGRVRELEQKVEQLTLQVMDLQNKTNPAP